MTVSANTIEGTGLGLLGKNVGKAFANSVKKWQLLLLAICKYYEKPLMSN